MVAAVAGGDPAYPIVQVRTLAHPALRVLRSHFYAPKKVVPGWLAEELNPRMLAFWFMDDGYTRIREGRRRPLAELATVSFSPRDLRVLLHGLLRLGLPAKAARGRLYFDVAASQRLSEVIAPFVPPCMRYKLDPEVADRIPFDPAALTTGRTSVLFDESEVEDVTDHPRGDVTFFCIDVEGTHNFVTAGGVVHNCRPPGNRDPLPSEIENCSGYLSRQVDLIEPNVICTLGNFSTKLLREDPTGITRLHGREEVRTLGHRSVRLYPIYHPAAALYTPRMLETLREDFARLPELLAMGAPPQPAGTEGGEEELASEAFEAVARGRREPAPEASSGDPASPDASPGSDQLDLF